MHLDFWGDNSEAPFTDWSTKLSAKEIWLQWFSTHVQWKDGASQWYFLVKIDWCVDVFSMDLWALKERTHGTCWISMWNPAFLGLSNLFQHHLWLTSNGSSRSCIMSWLKQSKGGAWKLQFFDHRLWTTQNCWDIQCIYCKYVYTYKFAQDIIYICIYIHTLCTQHDFFLIPGIASRHFWLSWRRMSSVQEDQRWVESTRFRSSRVPLGKDVWCRVMKWWNGRKTCSCWINCFGRAANLVGLVNLEFWSLHFLFEFKQLK